MGAYALNADGYQIAGQGEFCRKRDAIEWAKGNSVPAGAVPPVIDGEG